MQPVVNRLEDEFGDRVQVLSLNADGDSRDAFRAGGFKGHPAYVLLQPDGQEAWRGFGIVEYATILGEVRQALGG